MTQPPFVRGSGRGWTLGRNLLLVGIVGAILAASVVQSALSGIARVKAVNRAVRSSERLQRYQQDADMMRDALHSDVLSAVLTGRGTGVDPAEEIRAGVGAHADRLRADLSSIQRLAPEAGVPRSVAVLVPSLESYTRQAEDLVDRALSGPLPSDGPSFASFEEAFHRLEVSQAKATADLSRAARRDDSRAGQEEDAVQRRLFLLSGGALLGLVALAFALRRMGRKADSAADEMHLRDRRFAALVDYSSDVVTVVDAAGLITYESSAVERVLGYDPAGRVGTPVLDIVHPDDMALARSRLAGDWNAAEPVVDEIRARHRDGSWRWVEAVWSNLVDVPEVAGIVVNWREVGMRKALEEGLAHEREFFAAVLESLEDGVVACDADGTLTLFNDATRRFHGLPVAPVPACEWPQHYDLFLADQTTPMATEDIPLFRALAGEVVRDAEMTIAPRNGNRRLIAANGRAIYGPDGRKLGAVVAMHDTTERKEAERALVRQAFEDSLTGLGNRASLTAHVEAARRRAALTGSTLAVLVIDLDDFKRVNDSLGHAAGDLLLVETATRLRGCLRGPDVAVRLGGDEFVALLEDASQDQAISVADRILASVRAPFCLDARELTVGASIGIAVSEGGADDTEKMLRAADLAMYVAKSRGKGAHAVFEPDMHLVALGRLALEGDLRRALADNQFTLAYQPVIRLGDGAMVGVEALLRWDPPGRGPAQPDEFIPVAEDSGLIVPLGAWVLEEACAQARRWDEAFPDRAPLTVAVNVSGRQLLRSGLVDTLVDVLKRTGVEPARLVLEITESTLAGDDELALTTLWEIKRLGVRLSIDDFGTGYSSLSRLRTLPVAALKIDRSFVVEIDGPDAEAPLVVATLAMARGLGLSVVAEGIETTGQLEFLSRHGCPEAQGFLMGRPVEASAIAALLERDVPLVEVMGEPTPLGLAAVNGLTMVIESVITNRRGDDEAIQSLLAEMARITGLESTHLTEIHWDRFEQEVLYARNTGALDIGEGLLVDWADTRCRQALLGGPSNTDDVPGAYPESEAARRMGLQSYVSVPVPSPEGRIFGTLCGASSKRCKLGEAELAVFHLFARLIADRLGQSV